MIAPYFPPRRRVGALRPFRFATHLRDQGWRVAVAFIEDASAALTDDERARLEGIELWPIGTPVDRTTGQRSESDLGRDRSLALGARAPNAPESNSASLRRAAEALGESVDRAIPVDTWLPVLLAAFPRLARNARRWQPDAVWSTANPWSSHVLAEAVARIVDVPWIADFRDPWTLAEPYRRTVPSITQAIDRRVERRILRRADAVTFTANSTAERTIAAFQLERAKVHVLPNSYDSSLFERTRERSPNPQRSHDATVAASSSRPGSDSRREMLFFGRFRETSSAEPVIRVLAALRSRAPHALDALVVRSAGPLPPSNVELAHELGVDRCFETFDPVPYERAPERLSCADVLLVCKPSNRAEIVPAKLWDYLYVRRPVLAISDNAEVHEIVARTGIGAAFDNTQYEAIAELLVRYLVHRDELAQLLGFAPDEAQIARFDAASVTAELATLVERTIRRQ